MEWHKSNGARSMLIWTDSRFLYQKQTYSRLFCISTHLNSHTHTDSVPVSYTEMPTCAHSAVWNLMTVQTHSTLDDTDRYLLLLVKSSFHVTGHVFPNAEVAVKWGSLQHLKIRKENIDYKEISTFLSTFFLVFGTTLCHLIFCNSFGHLL